MIQKIIAKKVIPLVVAAGVGLLSVWLFQPQTKLSLRMQNNEQPQLTSGPDFGGDSSHTTPPLSEEESPKMSLTSPLKVTSKPRAQYTDQARVNNIQGVVRLRIALLADGSIGSITPLSSLPYGLTDQAIAAARQIKFEPRHVNGVPQSSTVTFEYSFTIY